MSFITDYAADKPRPRGKPGYRELLAAPDQWRIRGDLKTFYRRVRELAKLEQRARDAAVCSSGAA